MTVDYSLYLVTDSTEAIIGDQDLVKVVEAAIQGGVTVVQYRDKSSETRDLVRIGSQLHDVCRSYGVPLLINDRVDVALAIGAEGVHVGQDDMDIKTVRTLMGPHAIVGVTCSNSGEACIAAAAGATYLGIGTMFATPTKENTKAIIGTAGTREILHQVASIDPKISTVAIGGINASNVQHVMNQSKAWSKGLDGVAVVSAIIAAKDPRRAAEELRSLIGYSPLVMNSKDYESSDLERLLQKVAFVIKGVGIVKPVAHNMTNLVVQNFAANVALCIGASPIMSNNGDEAEDIASIEVGSLVINIGTVASDSVANYVKALRAYNRCNRPVLLDPVGAGATKIRQSAVKTLMSEGYFDVIKGNEDEIQTVLGETARQQKGVDSGTSELTDRDRARIVERLASRERNIVVMTGKVDFLSDGKRTFSIHNGHPFLGSITGSGCTLGTTIASCLAVQTADKLLAALSGIILFTIAAEHAGNEELIDTPKVNEEPLLSEAKKEKEIHYYRHKLQKGFLSRDTSPKVTGDLFMQSLSTYLGKLEEHPDLEVNLIRKTKIHKVLKAILQLPSIPKDEAFHFKERSHKLLQRWNEILQEDIIPEAKASGTTTPNATARAKFEPKVTGPGTFVPAFLDALYKIAQQTQNDDFGWLGAAEVHSEAIERD